MKALRNFKHRALCPDLLTLATGHSGNPLKKSVAVDASYAFTTKYIRSFRGQLNLGEASNHACVSSWIFV